MSSSMLSGRKGGGQSIASQAVIVDSFEKRTALRRAKIAGIVSALISGVLAFFVVNAVGASSSALMIAVVTAAVVGVVAFVGTWAWPVLRVLWHWAGEILVVVMLAGIYWWITSLAGSLVATGGVIAIVAIPFVFTASRQFVVKWGMCAIVRHRLRVACDAFVEGKGVHGAVKPFILVAKPTPAGESVWVWLRGSLTLEDVQARCGAIASTCWAQRATAETPRSKAAFVRIDLFRRNPLKDDIESPVVGLVKDMIGKNTKEPEGQEPSALSLDDIDEAEVEDLVKVNFSQQKKNSNNQAKTKQEPGNKKTAAVVDEGGDDISDWI